MVGYSFGIKWSVRLRRPVKERREDIWSAIGQQILSSLIPLSITH